MISIGAPIPVLRSFDEAKAKDFYVTYLGFEILFEHRFEPGFPLYFAVRRDACELHISEHHGDATPGSAVRIALTGVRAFCDDLNAKSTINAGPGVERSFGFDQVSVTDPFGNRLMFVEKID